MNPMTQDFISRLADLQGLMALFDTLPGVFVYAKDRQSRFMLANQAELRLLGIGALDEMIGKRDADFFEKRIAAAYVAEDQRVLAGQSSINQRQMVPDPDGRVRWYISSKTPLRGKAGEIVGLCGLLRDLTHADSEAEAYGSLAPVIEHINAHYKQTIKTGDLADLVGLSVSQLNRKFKAFTGFSPVTYILKVRLDAAQSQLLYSDMSVTEIAADLGFYDQSYFTRQFQKGVGMPPTAFRLRGSD